jgi:hypothetical protein
MARIDRYFRGTATFRSPLFSRTWTLTQNDHRLAVAIRHPWQRISEIELDDGTTWEIRPAGWGQLEPHSPDELLAEANRQAWTGRTWELFSPRFSYTLRGRSPALRTWSLDIVDAPVATFRGGKLTFNRLHVTADSPIPLEAVILTWHIIVRSWEAASAATGRSA